MPSKKDIKVRLRNRKNYLPTVLINIVTWGLIAFIFIYIDPALIRDIVIKDSYLVLLILMFISIFLSASLIAANTKRGFLISLGLTIFIFLRIKGLGNIVNAILITALVITVDTYSKPSIPN